jgi:hypothetical protein
MIQDGRRQNQEGDLRGIGITNPAITAAFSQSRPAIEILRAASTDWMSVGEETGIVKRPAVAQRIPGERVVQGKGVRSAIAMRERARK